MIKKDHTKQEISKHVGRSGRSILNSMIGEYLEKEKNPLAIQMGFYHRSKKLSLDTPLTQQLNAPLSNKVVILVHGLTQLETVWDFPKSGSSNELIINHYIGAFFDTPKDSGKEDYGSKLQEEFGYTPFYLRYNTGLSLEKNGRNFAAQLSKLFRSYPIAINELMLIGFSMGGTLLRHAQYSAQNNQFQWLSILSKCIYLGSPNESSPLDRMGYISRDILRRFPMRWINLWADRIGHRSNRLQSLKQGMKLLNESQDRVVEGVSYAESSRHYFIKSGINVDEQGVLSRVLGDTLVAENRSIFSSAPANSQTARIEGLSYDYSIAHSDRVYHLLAAWTKEAELCDQKPSAEALVRYSSVQEPSMVEAIPLDSPKQRLVAGVVDFLGSAYEKTLETVETMHYSITEEPFYLAQKLPIVSQIAKPVQAAHRNVLNNLYRSLRGGGRLMHKVAANIAPKEGAVRQF
ncbi:MAG: pimeloyl-ACP methyl ester carboxylesterase [Oleiphilaceae bacterium]|jgi:pimeloyl-ACP methyl ester carboxylesterase